MENANKVSDKTELVGEVVETQVQQKEGFWTKTKNFGKKHKKGLIAGAIAVVGTILICSRRKSDDEDDSFEESETAETETEVGTSEE